IAQRATPDRIHQRAVERGMTTLIEGGLRMAREGVTSLDEVLRILPPEQRSARPLFRAAGPGRAGGRARPLDGPPGQLQRALRPGRGAGGLARLPAEL